MGLFKSLLKEIVNPAENAQFTPDFSKSEYRNWLDYLSSGGTTEEWDKLIRVNNWRFKESAEEKYQKEVKTSADNYYYLLPLIQQEWSVLYNLKNFNGDKARAFEEMCLLAIVYYKDMHNIDLKYDKKTPLNVPAFTRLAMLYEKQGEYVKAAVVCKEACALGIDENNRLIRMLKKAGATPTE